MLSDLQLGAMPWSSSLLWCLENVFNVELNKQTKLSVYLGTLYFDKGLIKYSKAGFCASIFGAGFCAVGVYLEHRLQVFARGG